MMSETRFKTQLKDKVDYNSRIYPFARSLYRTYCNFAGPFHILPDFIIFGVSRSGTTSLYQYLSQHPNIEPSVVKEPRFFDMYFDRGINWYRMNFPSKWQKFTFTMSDEMRAQASRIPNSVVKSAAIPIPRKAHLNNTPNLM